MIEIGKINKLTVLSENSSGYYLGDDNDEENCEETAFMPPSLGPESLDIGVTLSVFVYLDSSDSLLATTKMPTATVGEYGFMKVVEITDFGVFVNWGISKDLLIPDSEQRFPIGLGDRVLVRVCLDERSDRIYGTTKTGKYILASVFDIVEWEEVDLIPFLNEELGYRVIVNKKFIGMIYHNEIFIDNIEIGKTYKGAVKKMRNDGLVDCSLQAIGKKNLVNSKDIIIEFLEDNGGMTSLCDKSPPEEIRELLSMSKKTFKNTIGILYKERRILIKKDGIELIRGND